MIICPEKCGKCCGCFPIKQSMLIKYQRRIQNKSFKVLKLKDNYGIPLTKSGICIFLTKKKRCAIYNSRPDVCRKYGLIDKLPCPEFNLNGSKRNELQKAEYTKQLDKHITTVSNKLGVITK